MPKINRENSDDPVIHRLQNNVNKALQAFGYDFAQRIETRIYTSEFPKVISHNMPKPATDLQLTYLRNTTDDTPPAAGVFVDWIPDQNGIRIRNITGLTAGKSYLLRFIIYA